MSAIRNVLRTPDLPGKILFTLLIIGVYRLGTQIPAPGVDLDQIETLSGSSAEGGLFAYLAIFTGSGIGLSLFALGILPYITSSIIIQILTVAVPKLEEWQAQGAVGQRKINQWTRYIAIALALVQSTGYVFLIQTSPERAFGVAAQIFPQDAPFLTFVLAVTCMTVGTAIVMWLAELVTQKGIGNGMSVIIFASVVATVPALGGRIFRDRGLVWLLVAFVALVILCAGIVFVEQGQRRIPVNFAKRVVGRKQYGGNNSYIPLKVNQAGVIPVIFASSLFQLPSFLTSLLPVSEQQFNPDGTPALQPDPNWADRVNSFVVNNLNNPQGPVYIVFFGLLIVGFAYFYNSIAFDPVQRADQIRKQGGFIPGIRPGHQTETYLAKILNRVTLPGAIFLALIAVIPSALLAELIDINTPGSSGLLGFGGISVLIGVGVSLEIMKQINSLLMARNYEGFLK